MARSDLIVNLVKASVTGDEADVRATAEAIAADERAKKHTGVADRIARALDAPRRNNGNGHDKPVPRVRDGSGGIQQREPRRAINELYLDMAVRSACDELIEEQRRADVLRAHGMEPRHRVLLAGPPGNGKTSLAEAIAYELALPLFTVNGARAMGRDGLTGALAPGRSADFIVLDRALDAVEPAAIADTRVLTTVFEGEVVHESDMRG